MTEQPTTAICRSTADDVYIRGRSLTKELMGSVSFTGAMFFQILGRMPTNAEQLVLDACLVALMEHGLTPTVLACRLTYSSSPNAMQAAVGAGLCGVGPRWVGTMKGCGEAIARILAAEDQAGVARAIVAEHNRRVPGFGHPQHRPDDPRAMKLLQLAEDVDVAGAHVTALRLLAEAVDAAAGRHVTINVTGAIAAVLGDCGVPAEIMQGFAIISRCAGLVGHIHEEQQDPTLMTLWHTAEQVIPYND